MVRLPELRRLIPVAVAVVVLVVVASSLQEADAPQVPGVVGLAFEPAAERLRERGYVPARGETRNPGGGRCAVHRQRPAPFTAAAKGTRVRLDLDCAFDRY